MKALIIFARLTAVLILVPCVDRLWAQPPGVTIIDLETLGNDFSEAYDVNNRGEVIGRSGGRAIIWTWREGMVDLGTPPGESSSARAINDRGEVIGRSGERGFYWSRTTGLVDLGTAGGDSAYPLAINELGQVVGSSTYLPGSWVEHAFLWSRERGLEDLGTLGGNYSVALDINDLGEVIGMSETHKGKGIPFLWTRETGMVRFMPPTYPAPNVLRINNRGEVTGRLVPNAFFWSSDTGLIDLGNFGGAYSVASELNEAGQIAGYGDMPGAGDPHAFLWSLDYGLEDLGSLGGRSLSVADMNESGQVTGWGWLGSDFPITLNAFVASAESGILALGTLDGRNSVGQAINDRGQIAGYSSVAGSRYPHATMWIFLTPAEQVEGIIEHIQDLVAEGEVPGQPGLMLIAPLESFKDFWNTGRPTVAGDKLRSFIRLLGIFSFKGVLTIAQAELLIDQAEWILFQLEG